MNNEFLTVITYLKDLLANDPDITVVTHGVSNDIDLNKNSNYPLAHLQFVNFNPNYQMGMISFLFEVHILSIRDISKTPSSDLWLRNDNELDNYNRTSAIANRLYINLKQFNENNIDVVNITPPEVISLDFMNMLDGCRFQVELAMSNLYDPCN